MPSNSDVIIEARSWVGTPYHHQQCRKGHGVDCAQLVAGVGAALGLMPMLSRDLVRYARTPNPKQMQRVLEMHMVQVDAAAVEYGDVFWMCWRPGLPQHLGFFSDLHGSGMIHSHGPSGGVVETILDDSARAMIHGWWRYRGLN